MVLKRHGSDLQPSFESLEPRLLLDACWAEVLKTDDSGLAQTYRIRVDATRDLRGEVLSKALFDQGVVSGVSDLPPENCTKRSESFGRP